MTQFIIHNMAPLMFLGLVAGIELENRPGAVGARAMDCHIDCFKSGLLIRTTADIIAERCGVRPLVVLVALLALGVPLWHSTIATASSSIELKAAWRPLTRCSTQPQGPRVPVAGSSLNFTMKARSAGKCGAGVLGRAEGMERSVSCRTPDVVSAR